MKRVLFSWVAAVLVAVAMEKVPSWFFVYPAETVWEQLIDISLLLANVLFIVLLSLVWVTKVGMGWLSLLLLGSALLTGVFVSMVT